MPSMESVTNELDEGVRAHYASGYYDLETALLRIQNGGFVERTREQASAVLSQPISVSLVKELTGKSGENFTEEQIAVRLAEVSA